MESPKVNSFEEMEISLIMGNEKLKSAYEVMLLERIKFNQRTEKLKSIELSNAIKKEKKLDNFEEKGEDESNIDMYPENPAN